MKIAILVTFFPPKWLAGTEIATYSLAEHLAERGHEVHVITSKDEGLPEESFENGFHIHRLSRIRVRFVGVIIFWIRIVRAIYEINPDIIHVQSLGNTLPAIISKKLFKKLFIVWGQGSDVYLPDWFTKLASKTSIKNADAVIALTNDMKQKMQAIYSRDIFVIPNGIDLKKYTCPPRNLKQKDEKTILFVGRLHPVKGVQYLVEAMALIHQELPGINLVIVGDGPERERLEELVKKLDLTRCIQFKGRVPHEIIPEFMHKADIFLVPSLSEGFSIVTIEAMAAGLPIVATNVGGIPEIVEDGVNGVLLNPMKPEEIARGIIRLIKNEKIREKMSMENQEKSKMYSWERVTVYIENLYFYITNKKGNEDIFDFNEK